MWKSNVWDELGSCCWNMVVKFELWKRNKYMVWCSNMYKFLVYVKSTILTTYITTSIWFMGYCICHCKIILHHLKRNCISYIGVDLHILFIDAKWLLKTHMVVVHDHMQQASVIFCGHTRLEWPCKFSHTHMRIEKYGSISSHDIL